MGEGISRRASGWLATGAVGGAFVAAPVDFGIPLSRDLTSAFRTSRRAYDRSAAGRSRTASILIDPLPVLMMAIVADGRLIVGYRSAWHRWRRRGALLRVYVAFRFDMLAAATCRLGAGLLGLVGLPVVPDRLLGTTGERGRAAKKAFVMNAPRRDDGARCSFAIIQHTSTSTPASFYVPETQSGNGFACDARRPRPPRRRGRQVGGDPVPDVAPGREWRARRAGRWL